MSREIPKEAIDEALKHANHYGRHGMRLESWDWSPPRSGTADPRGHWYFSFGFPKSGTESD